MSYDGTILARARDRLDGVREQNAREHETRVMRAYAAKPELRAIDAALRAQMTELVRLTLSGETEKIEALREESLELQRRRGELLRQLGHGEDWLDEIVSCGKCRDSGVYRGGVCDCLKRLYNEELTRDLGVLLRNGDESFEKFDLSLYDEEYRGKMRTVYEIAGAYAENFSPAAGNLLFQGGTGLGKTFLSACVARAVAEKGFSNVKIIVVDKGTLNRQELTISSTPYSEALSVTVLENLQRKTIPLLFSLRLGIKICR